jgi:hypothetical protein
MSRRVNSINTTSKQALVSPREVLQKMAMKRKGHRSLNIPQLGAVDLQYTVSSHFSLLCPLKWEIFAIVERQWPSNPWTAQELCGGTWHYFNNGCIRRRRILCCVALAVAFVGDCFECLLAFGWESVL